MNTIQILQTRIERLEPAIRQLKAIRIALCEDRERNMPSFISTNTTIPISGIARNKLIQGLKDDITDLEIQIDALKLQIQKLQDNEQEIRTN